MEGGRRGRTARQWHRSGAARPTGALALAGCGEGSRGNEKRATVARSAFWNIQRTERLSDHHSADIQRVNVQPPCRFAPCRVKARSVN